MASNVGHWMARRLFSTTRRCPASTPSVKEIGYVIAPLVNEAYPCGQLFVHRLFAYKGIILCAFDCKTQRKTEGSNQIISGTERQYQVLVHRGDWSYMGFPVDMTAYLADGGGIGGRGEKLLTTMAGMDCVPHNDIVPFIGTERAPIDHDLVERIFIPEQADGADVRYMLRPEIRQFYLSSTKSWMAPRDVNREITEGIDVTVTTFYLGQNIINGQQRYTWRYVIRVHNLSNLSVVLRERQLKVFTLQNMHQLSGHGVVGRQPELSPNRPAFQFSSTVDIPQAKGGYMWGKFKMERENGSLFDVNIPMFKLDTAQPPEAIETKP